MHSCAILLKNQLVTVRGRVYFGNVLKSVAPSMLAAADTRY